MRTKAIILGAMVLGGWTATVSAAEPPAMAPFMQNDPNAGPYSPSTQPPAASQPVIVPGNPGSMLVPAQPPQIPPSNGAIPAVTGAPALPPGSVCSPWNGPGGTGCCGPIGGNGPIMTEGFLRTGIALPVAGGIFNNVLNPAYMFSVGARSMFFNVKGSAAWTVEYGIDYFYNNGNHPEQVFDVFGTFVDIREYHRSAVHISFGRELFIFSPAYQCGTNYRFGVDWGGRYGYSRVNFNLPDSPDQTQEPTNTTHRSDVFGAVLIGFHADYEVPISNCMTLIAGIRAEWAYNFTDIIPTWDTDLQEAIIMLNLGFRF
ncbi:MAG: hypothetical protein ACJ8C4_03090 [Gemmataceae bacterium]